MLVRVLDGVDAFLDQLGSVSFVPLALAIGCHLLKMACTSRAWRNVLAAAYPDERVPWISIYGAYLAGVGINAIVPARAGDAVRIVDRLHRLRQHVEQRARRFALQWGEPNL